jgi:ABC-type Fe3+-hydroxamate transport system substrate-binding protein
MNLLDQLNRKIKIESPPKRIVSLVPSITELLFDLGLEDRIVGITRFCTEPATHVKNVLKIGGTKNFNIEKIENLKPDLIIGNKEENYKEGIEKLSENFPVFVTDINNFSSSLSMISLIGQLTGKEKEANCIIAKIKEKLNQIDITPKKKAAYFIWKNPWMVAGGDTYISSMMEKFGYDNIFKHKLRYPEIELADLHKADSILLSSEPYRFREKHLLEFKSRYPNKEIKLIDGTLFSWYGSRLANLLIPKDY